MDQSLIIIQVEKFVKLENVNMLNKQRSFLITQMYSDLCTIFDNTNILVIREQFTDRSINRLCPIFTFDFSNTVILLNE